MRRRDWLLASLPLSGCAAGPPQPLPRPAQADAAGTAGSAGPDMPPPAPREFRAAWVATVANIDWPSKPGLPSAGQQAEALAILDRAREIGLNALVLQVRPAADALYLSELEPWSEYLTGSQGLAPNPLWDPLAFWVEEAHRRGLELHAWFNPYRARQSSSRSAMAADHISRTRPAAVKAYGDQLWMDPGEGQAMERTLAVLRDVVRRYDVDGVHIDDYFYPYPVKQGAAELPFPDDPAYARYREAGGRLSREDWRRDNVDRLVQAMYREVHALRPAVRVGISPFGLGRPDRRPPGVVGFSQYDQLYADVERWLAEGWLDYLAPQLYWPIAQPGQPFGVLLDYWQAQNPLGRHLWPGLFTSRIGDPRRPWPMGEVIEQVSLVRSRPAASGHVHFSMAALMQDRDGIANALNLGPYAQAALVPATPWLDAVAPGAPRARPEGGGWRLEPGPGKTPFLWAVWQRRQGRWRFAAQPAAQVLLRPAPDAEAVVVSAVDRVGNESERRTLGRS